MSATPVLLRAAWKLSVTLGWYGLMIEEESVLRVFERL